MQVHDYLRGSTHLLTQDGYNLLNDEFKCSWKSDEKAVVTGSYNNFIRVFDRSLRMGLTWEAGEEVAEPRYPRRVSGHM